MRDLFLSAGFFLACVSAAQGQGVVAGKVAETMDSGGYTYVRVVQGKESTWVAAPQQKIKVGEEVAFSGGMVMVDFKSKSLNRTFKKIIFSDGPVKGGSAAQVVKGIPEHGPAAAQFPIKLAKAEGPGAYTVAEVYGRRKDLAGKTVSVRGKVMKVSLEIMGRNWVHLQDGSGDQKAGTNDLLVTTSEEVKAGETVTARGAVAKDQDFGSGYKYVVLLEKATFK